MIRRPAMRQGEAGMKKRRSWKLSQGGAALFLLLLLAPFLIRFLTVWPSHRTSQWWAWPLYVALTVFFAALLWFCSLRPLIRQRLWKIPRTWYEGCLGVAMVYIFYALFVFVTGYSPSKYNSHPVPRSAGVIFLYWALAPLIIGSAFYVYDKGKKRHG